MTPEEIEQRLHEKFPDCDALVEDLTGGMNHFEVRIASKAFAGKSRIDQQRLVMDALAPELKTGEVHALTIKTVIKNS